MPFDLTLPNALKALTNAGWKVKVSDKEYPWEEPHVTIIWRRFRWRVRFSDGEFMDKTPKPGDVPKALLQHVFASWGDLQVAWNAIYPHNPYPPVADGEEEE
jgi:hypothetical protein